MLQEIEIYNIPNSPSVTEYVYCETLRKKMHEVNMTYYKSLFFIRQKYRYFAKLPRVQ
jgi:hypothetical protein